MEATISSASARNPAQSAACPPLILGISPPKARLLAQIQPEFWPQAKRILAEFPRISHRRTGYVAALPDGTTARLGDSRGRIRFAQAAIGDIWETGNLAELFFKWRRPGVRSPCLEVETTKFTISFHDHENCQEFLAQLEGQWEDWASHAERG